MPHKREMDELVYRLQHETFCGQESCESLRIIRRLSPVAVVVPKAGPKLDIKLSAA